MRKIKKQKKQTTKNQTHNQQDLKPFIDHLHELRRRLVYIVLAVTLFGACGYLIQQRLVNLLLRPAKGQQFIYTTPAGGLNFLFQACLYFGLILSVPIIIFQLLKFLEPLLQGRQTRVVVGYSSLSGLLAIAGGCFGYFIGLPAALAFLASQFTTTQIKPLLTIQEYMSFVMLYIVGCALLFQIPLILLFINRIKPLKPSKLLSWERYFIVFSFIAAAILTPTPDIFNMMMFALPILSMYQIGILAVYLKNRKSPSNNTNSRQAVLESELIVTEPPAEIAPQLAARIRRGVIWDITGPPDTASPID